MPKVKFVFNGCKVRRNDLEEIENFLRNNNFNIVDKDEDIAILMLCAFAEERENDSINTLKNYEKNKVILTGCYHKIAADRIDQDYTKVDTIKNLEAIANAIRSKGFDIANFDYSSSNCSLITVQSGCTGSCSHCCIKQAIGNVKSKDINYIQNRISKINYNYSIMGDDVGSWGVDINKELPNLLNILDPQKVELIRYISPWKLLKYKNELKSFLDKTKNINVMIPLHTASARITDLMNRPDSDKLQELREVLLSMKENKAVKLSTQIVVGFPSETKDDFVETLNYINRIFTDVEFFAFSPRPNTLAYDMENRVSIETIESWYSEYTNFIKSAFSNSFLYKNIEVVK